MLQNPNPNQYKEIPLSNIARKFEYVFLEPRGDISIGISVIAHFYKNAKDFVFNNCQSSANIGFVEINLKTDGVTLFNAMHNLALESWPDFVKCSIPTLIGD